MMWRVCLGRSQGRGRDRSATPAPPTPGTLPWLMVIELSFNEDWALSLAEPEVDELSLLASRPGEKDSWPTAFSITTSTGTNLPLSPRAPHASRRAHPCPAAKPGSSDHFRVPGWHRPHFGADSQRTEPKTPLRHGNSRRRNCCVRTQRASSLKTERLYLISRGKTSILTRPQKNFPDDVSRPTQSVLRPTDS